MATAGDGGAGFLQKFRLYETKLKFYLIGRYKSTTQWRVLKIDRTEPAELCLEEDPAFYSEVECQELLKRIHEGNRLIGGLKFVTKCYGIVGIVRFLGPYYILLITRRKKVGTICGHAVYTISKTKTYVIPNVEVHSNMSYPKDENRYKRLLCSVDLRKDFFFSYSYKIMLSLQKNVAERVIQQAPYDNMFVWNYFLTQGIRNHLSSNNWTVALVHGFFKQSKLSISGKDFWLTLISRRSRHFAGTRYLKRGVNENGKVANDVETEQIVFEDKTEGIPSMVASVVQHRGSIPLIWFQETSPLNIKPPIILKKDTEYKATCFHFEDLIMRYGVPIIILNLIKTCEKKPRESLLRAEFAKAIHHINKSLPKENRLMFIHFDLNKYSRRKVTNVLALLGEVADNALDHTGFFHCQTASVSMAEGVVRAVDGGNAFESEIRNDDSDLVVDEEDRQENDLDLDSYWDEVCKAEGLGDQNEGLTLLEPLLLQKGVLRTNCIDCLDRTNVAQFSYGLAALGRQLYALELTDTPKIDIKASLADNLMDIYERMGDTLALQYGGSAAHNKIFSERRGQWKAATRSQEFVRTLQRYYNNVYMDAEKQNAIDVFLGYFKLHNGPTMQKLDESHPSGISRQRTLSEELSRQLIKRSMSDGNILGPISTPCSGDSTPASNFKVSRNNIPDSDLHSLMQDPETTRDTFDSAPEIVVSDSSVHHSRYLSAMPCKQLFSSVHQKTIDDVGLHELRSSNFLNFDWLSSSENSFDDTYERSSLLDMPIDNISVETTATLTDRGVHDEAREETDAGTSQSSSKYSDIEYSDRFAHWVANGEMLCF